MPARTPPPPAAAQASGLRRSEPAALQLGLFDAPAPAASAPHTRHIQLQGMVLGYALKRGKRRTIGFTIDDAGLSVAAPRWVTLAEIDAAIREKSRWIVAKLAEWRAHRAQLPTLAWRDGASIPVFGVQTRLRLAPEAREVVFDAQALTLTLPLAHDAAPAQIRDRVQGWMQERARALFAQRLAVYCARLQLPVGVWKLSSARTRWGSCTSDGTIRLNWRLLHFPMSVIDYVVAHEVAHRQELNHSPRFWRTVESIFPEFRAAEELLKFHAPAMLERA